MKNSDKPAGMDSQQLIKRLYALESRISRIEARLGYVSPREALKNEGDEGDTEFKIRKPEDSTIESNLVEYGLSWLSTIVFVFGIIFLMSYIRNIGYPILASLTGYLAVTALFVFTYLFRNTFSHITTFLNTSAFLLLYIVTLRLHYFSPQPVVSASGSALVLLGLAWAAQAWYSIKKRSEFLGFVSVLLLLITGIISDSTYIILSTATLAAALSLVYFIQFNWWRQLIAAVFLVYVTHLIWLSGNAFMGHPLKFVTDHQYNIVFLFIYGLIFSSTIIVSKKDMISENVLGFISVLNAMIFSVLILLITVLFYKDNYTGIFAFITLLCLAFSILLKYKTDQLFAPSLYACLGFMAMSVCIYGFADLPNSFYWLALESLLVVSMALWFRSKLIVVTNTLLFIIILLIYLFNSPSVDGINFIFAIVALLTARIVNWKKDRLTLKTEIYRNIYLMIVFFIVLYGLSHAVSTQYVTLSWTGAAILYLLLSVLLKNIKYRWMSFMTLIFTGGHLLFVDMAKMDMGYRVIAFLFFAAITIGLTLYYTKWIKKKSSSGE